MNTAARCDSVYNVLAFTNEWKSLVGPKQPIVQSTEFSWHIHPLPASDAYIYAMRHLNLFKYDLVKNKGHSL